MGAAAARARVRGGPRWLRGARAQMRVIGALMIKEAMGRYGHEGLGFFWVIGEPLLLTGGVMILWTLAGASHGADIGVIPFALTGYSFITLWRHIVNRSAKVMTQHAHLRYHRQIKYLDIMIARAALETTAIFAAFIVAYVPLYLLGYCPPLRDPLALVGGFTLTAVFSFGFGAILAGLSELNESVHFFIGPFMYLTIPLTGIFFMVDWLPAKVQTLILWSPLVNGVEMFRSGLFPQEIVAHWSISYLGACAACTTCAGVILCHFVERRIQS